MGLRGFLTTLGLGAGTMYFYDPDQGERRRAMLRDQATKMQNDMQDLWSKGTRDLQNRAQGFQSRARSMVTGEAFATGNQAGAGAMEMPVEWDPGQRLLALGGGSILTLYGLIRGGISGKLVSLAGLNFLTRGLMNKSLVQMVRPSREGAISVRKGLHIDAPVEEVFNFWRNYENFPRFMSHIQEVREMGGDRSHWVAKGPAGAPVEWDAHITQMQPNQVLAWESLPGSQVYNAGRVRFTQSDGGTDLNIYMTYSPPGGAAGHAIASLFGADPKSAMDEDLNRLQSLFGSRGKGGGGQGGSGGQGGMGGGQGGTSGGRGGRGSTGGGQANISGQQTAGGSQNAQGRRESGTPGGGQGRTDVVGQTGVYPASGPMPEGDAEIQGMASWGQGERGAAGYEDSGSSELSMREPDDRKPGSSRSGSGPSGGSQSGGQSGTKQGSGK